MLPMIEGMLIAILVTLVATPFVKKAAIRLGVVDKPDARKVHQGLIPRMGGIAIYLGFVLAVLCSGYMKGPGVGLVVSASVVVLVGLIDDIFCISPTMKLAGQFVAALIFCYMVAPVEFITNPFTNEIISLGLFSWPLTVIWLIGVSNAVNLIDGLDGLAAGVSAISAFTMMILSLWRGQMIAAGLALFLACAAVAFLRYNFHPAQIFMGDCGSLFLGFVLAGLSVISVAKAATIVSVFVVVVILGIPILDTFFAIIRRMKNHRPIFQADKGHLHHCLLARGLSQTKAVLVIYVITICFSICAIAMSMVGSTQALFILFAMSVVVVYGAHKLGILARNTASVKENNNVYHS